MPNTKTSFHIMAITILLLTNSLKSIDPVLEPEFRESIQHRSFIVDINHFHPVPTEPNQSWAVTPQSVALISLNNGDVIRKILLNSSMSCHHSPSARNHMLYSLDKDNRKLYGLSLANGRVEKDLKLPFFEGDDWVKKSISMDCLEEGLELGFGDKKFVFYKNYSEEQVLLSEESLSLNKQSNSEISKKDMFNLKYSQDKEGKIIIF